MALLRFVEPSEGRVIIDGLDISQISLQDLRSRVTIIPQDAVLFSGTIRENLDPFQQHSDEECLDVIVRVHLNGTKIGGHPTRERKDSVINLSTKVSAGGANFSQGQRQLLAMARALLRQSRIIIMDEATSSIDFEADLAVQQTIREEFTDALLITIAHRIRTVIDYDRLIVMDNGQIVESDTPNRLIQKEGGVFRGMCLKSGRAQFEELLEASGGRTQT